MRSKYFNHLILSVVLFLYLTSCSNNTEYKKSNDKPVTTDSIKTVAGYKLPIPDGWTTEKIFFPIDFAPQIEYTGLEDLRFAKGWEEIASEEHWSYAFLWWLDGNLVINDTILQQHLTGYYSGLVKRNITSRSIPALKVVPTTVKINSVTTDAGDIATFKGTVNMLDYIAQTPMTLNCIVHVKDCGIKDKTAILFEVSPQKETHAIWQTLNKLNTGISFKQ